jgi:hypothetical protein
MWKVIRQGHENEEWKVLYDGSRELAAEKYVEVKKEIQQGSVALVDLSGEITARVSFSESQA